MSQSKKTPRIEDSETWLSLDPPALMEFALEQILEYGYTDDLSRIPLLQPLYRYVVDVVDRSERLRMLSFLASEVFELRISPRALLPFLHEDTDVRVISTAALELAQMSPLEGGDPLTGSKVLMASAEKAPNTLKALGILRGLLLLGDRRLNPLLDGCWRLLHDEDLRGELACSWSGFSHPCKVDFLLSWLESGEATNSDWTAILASLARMAQESDTPRLRDIRRRFPIQGDGETPPEAPKIEVLQEWEFAEYAESIWPRLEPLLEQGKRPTIPC